jgi:hypothetical protein
MINLDKFGEVFVETIEEEFEKINHKKELREELEACHDEDWRSRDELKSELARLEFEESVERLWEACEDV